MCCCKTPNINGKPGYSWDGKNTFTREVDPPEIQPGDGILYDLPGRCGGLDSHCLHFRVVKEEFGGAALLARHGGRVERYRLRDRPGLEALAQLSDDGRYWILQMFYMAMRDAANKARQDKQNEWTAAALEKRIKLRSRNRVPYVEILQRELQPTTGN